MKDLNLNQPQDAEALRREMLPEYADWQMYRTEPNAGTLDFDEYRTLRDMWRMLGGRWYGPNVEHGSMPEHKLLPILQELLAVALKHGGPTPRAMVLGDLYAYRTFGWHQFDWHIVPTEWWL
jgi:hypothetical protein